MWTAPTILIKNTLKKYRSTKSYWKYWPSTFIFNIYFLYNVSRVSSFRFHKQTWRIFCKTFVSYSSKKMLIRSDQNPRKIPYKRFCLQWSCWFPVFITTKSVFLYIYFSGFCQLLRYTYFKKRIFLATSAIYLFSLFLLSCKRVSKTVGQQ